MTAMVDEVKDSLLFRAVNDIASVKSRLKREDVIVRFNKHIMQYLGLYREDMRELKQYKGLLEGRGSIPNVNFYLVEEHIANLEHDIKEIKQCVELYAKELGIKDPIAVREASIEENDEMTEIEKEKEKTLRQLYEEKNPGKHAEWNGGVTQGYLEWKKLYLEKVKGD